MTSSGPTAPTSPFNVTVSVTKGSGGGYTVTLNPSTKLLLSAANGDSVVWDFQNNSGKDMDLGIGNFKPKPPANTVNPDWDQDPFESSPRRVKVAHGKSGNVQARVKKNAKSTRTYKYDILDGTTVLEDPEIEIRP